MKKIFAPVLALTMLASPLAAQGETPMQMAERLDACDGREILGAEVNDANELVVRCAREAGAGNDGAAGNGLITTALGLGAMAALVGAVAGGGSSSDTQ